MAFVLAAMYHTAHQPIKPKTNETAKASLNFLRIRGISEALGTHPSATLVCLEFKRGAEAESFERCVERTR